MLGVIMVIVGSLLISQFGSSDTKRTAEVEVVQPITPDFNSEAKEILLGRSPEYPVNSFAAPFNLSQGFGNTNPFSGN